MFGVIHGSLGVGQGSFRVFSTIKTRSILVWIVVLVTLGMLEPHYVRSSPFFTAADRGNRILTSVNIVPSYRKGEATIDLMRRRIDIPNGIMDYLFVRLFLQNREKGFERFNLGIAAMSGFKKEKEPL